MLDRTYAIVSLSVYTVHQVIQYTVEGSEYKSRVEEIGNFHQRPQLFDKEFVARASRPNKIKAHNT
jgi:hypothetical protein